MANWASDLRLGHPAVDDDHGQLVLLVNELADAVDSRRPRDQVAQVMADLLTASGEHFCREEQAMRRARYTGFAHHKHLHDDLLRELRLAVRAVETGARAIDAGLVDWLRGWLVHHIRTEDAAFVTSLAGETRLSA